MLSRKIKRRNMKIEEMASSTYFLQQHSGWLTNEELEDVEHGIKIRKEAFIKGAKAVLEEIEKCLSYTIPLDEVFTHIELTIADLKGE